MKGRDGREGALDAGRRPPSPERAATAVLGRMWDYAVKTSFNTNC